MTWRAARQARREAWRARRAERRARWAHLADPAFWGLDEASMRGMRSGTGPATGMGAGPASEVAELKAQIQDMTRTIASLSERVIVLEKLATDDDRKLAVEIEKLRGQKE